MNKLAFKHRLHYVISRASEHITVSRERVIAVLSGSAVSQPIANFEPFIMKMFGFSSSDFNDPTLVGDDLRTEAVDKLTSAGTFDIDFVLLEKAASNAFGRMQLRRHMFDVCDAQTAAESLPTSTSSGFPSFQRPKGELVPEVIGDMCRIIMSGDFTVLNEVMVSYVAWRTQERSGGTKFRQFFIFPQIINAFEMMFMKPILDYYINMPPSITNAYSFHAQFPEQRLIWEHAQTKAHTYGLDYSSFDLSISQKLLAYALFKIKTLFKLSPWQARLFDAIITCHVDSFVVTSFKGQAVIIKKRSGILSGSVFTNFLGTVCNLIMLEYALLKLVINSNEVDIKVKGDDTLIMTNLESFPFIKFVRLLEKSFGVLIKPESCEVFGPGEPIFYLGYYFTNSIRLSKSTDLLIRKMAISGRYFDEAVMPQQVRITSKIVSILSNVSNGYDIFYELIWPYYKWFFNTNDLPEYYFDLGERGTNVYFEQRPVLMDLKYGWMTR